MPFRATNSVTSDAYIQVKRAATQLRVNLVGFKDQLAASGADYDFLHGIYMTLKRADDQFTTLKTTPGLAQYAKDQEDDQTYDVVQAFTDMQAAITSAGAWMQANVPTDVTAKSPSQWDGSSMIADTFTPAQTAGLQTAIQAVIDEII